MERIETFDQYKRLVAQAKTLPHVCSNCYLLPGAVREKIEKGVLYAEEEKNGSLILEREPGFFRCYYYLTPDMEGERVTLPLPAVAELVFNREITQTQRAQIGCLERMGFRLGRRSGRKRFEDAAAAMAGPTDGVTYAREDDLEAVQRMIAAAFDPLYSYISTAGEMLQGIRDHAVFVIREDGRIVAVLYSELSKTVAEIRQIVVSGGRRRQGYGQRLVSFYHEHYRGSARAFAHWVDMANEKAIGLYAKFGYSFDGRYANEYIIQ